MDKMTEAESDFAFDVLAKVITAGGDIVIDDVLANFRLLGRGIPINRACIRTGDHPAFAAWTRDTSMALTVVHERRSPGQSPDMGGSVVVAQGQKAPREEDKGTSPRVVAGYTIYEHPAQLVVALSTAQIVAKAMQLCYREDEIADDVIDGPLLLMVTAKSADPYMGKKGGNPYPSGQRYEEWATKALQEIVGETPQTWSRIVADGGVVNTDSKEHKEVARALCRTLCRRVLRLYIVERLERWLDRPDTAPGQASHGAVNVLLAAAEYPWMVSREASSVQPAQAQGGPQAGGFQAGRGAGGRGASRGGGRGGAT